MYIYKQHGKYTDPLHIIFLCGSKFSIKDPSEKRTILKRHIESSIPECHAIILEEHFRFTNTTKDYLAYDDIFLYSLAQIEELASLFADNIIIIHETISTAAELGLFAANPSLVKKICLLTPDPISIEENKISTFIQKAFFVSKHPETTIGKHIIYYPDVHVHRDSCNKSEYWTAFHNNTIGDELSKSLLTFLRNDHSKSEICFRALRYGKANTTSDTIDYYISKDENIVYVTLCAKTLKILLLSLLLHDTFLTKLNTGKPIKDHVTDLTKTFSTLMIDSISILSDIDISNYRVKISIKTSSCTIRQAIGYYIYMLQGIGLVRMEQVDTENAAVRRILPTSDLINLKKRFPVLITEYPQTAFGRLIK